MGHGANYGSKSNPEFQARWAWVMAGAGNHGVKASLGRKRKQMEAWNSRLEALGSLGCVLVIEIDGGIEAL